MQLTIFDMLVIATDKVDIEKILSYKFLQLLLTFDTLDRQARANSVDLHQTTQNVSHSSSSYSHSSINCQMDEKF